MPPLKSIKSLPLQEKTTAFMFGLAFVLASIILAIFFPSPTPYQYTVFRIVLALSAAGVAAIIPGFVQLRLRNLLRAGGAIAVFVIVYFFNPASLLVESQDRGRNTSGSVSEVNAKPVVRGREVALLDAPGGKPTAHLFANTEIEIRERAGAFCEVYLYGYVFDDALSEKRRGTTTVVREAYVWSNPWGWFEEFGLPRQPDNYRLGRLLVGSTVDVIEVEDPEVYVRKIRAVGWIPATEIAGGITYQRRTNGDLREWLSDGKVAVRVSDVTRGEGLKVYFQLRNPQRTTISVREVRAELFDSRGGVGARILSLERQDIAHIAPSEVRLFSLDSDGHPVWPSAIELRVFLDDNSQSGPFIVTWESSQIAGTDRD